jgi:hypothetical protein
MRHVLTHLTVVAVGAAIAVLAGVPAVTALPIAMVAVCAAMIMTIVRHVDHDPSPTPQTEHGRNDPQLQATPRSGSSSATDPSLNSDIRSIPAAGS